MKLRKFKLSFFVACMAVCVCFTPNVGVKANAQYEIVFKAGLHGSIENERSVSYPVEAGSMFPNEPTVVAQEGYVFKGWNKALPEVGSVVEGKQTYVAQYDVLVSGVNYIVRYVDQNNADIATPKSSMAEEGTTIIERAKVVSGYTFNKAQQEFKVLADHTEFTITYTLVNPEEVIRYEDEIINLVVPGTEGQNNTENGNNNPNNNVNNDQTTNEDNNNQNNKEDVKGNETPLAKGDKEKDYTYLYVAGCGVLLVLILGYFYVYKKKQKHTEHKS